MTQVERSLLVHVFRDGFKPFLLLLNEHDVKYQIQANRAGVQAGAGGILEIIQTVGAAAIWASLASVVIAYINSRRTRKVIITLADNTVVHAEGLTMKELEYLLEQAKTLSALDTSRSDESGQSFNSELGDRE